MERQEEACAGAFVGAEFQNGFAVELDVALGDVVAVSPRQGVAQSGFTCAVGAHDGMDLACGNLQIQAVEDGFVGVFHAGVEVGDGQQGVGGGHGGALT